MRIPKQVKVGWRVYDIEVVEPDKLEDDIHIGRTHHWRPAIYLNSKLTAEQRECVLIHEILHGILYQAGKVEHEDEWLITCLENGLIALMKDNPGIFDNDKEE